MVKVKRRVTVVTLANLLVRSVLLSLSDKGMSVADTSVPSDEVTSSQIQANSSSASATITITMYTGDDE